MFFSLHWKRSNGLGMMSKLRSFHELGFMMLGL